MQVGLGLNFNPKFFMFACEVSIFLFLLGGSLEARSGCFSANPVSPTVTRGSGRTPTGNYHI